ncbi:uncharacterized protein SEPMUDRAFT_147780 [Sphaerulina musiva SO2202]|uniref:Uncharacterized protein n=1 Tax=Sphaerulina musiva (strain SO2202) TaxID=692275 RepID=M3DEB1_SPHMS|nr:uncharacterized protein SEPMUDRAFT_147780 [Sphaerulina musiva SO2202]EMF16125.1 hypothetical protein SEPMUDRAFT_147780 [Sphaerulina musiva SO2202]
MHNTRRRKENGKRFFIPTEAKEYQCKYSSGLSVSEEFYAKERSDNEYPKKKNLFLSH